MKREEDQFKKWMHEAGREHPGMGFSNRVLAAIQKEASEAFEYRPVISPVVMRIIVGAIALFFVAALFIPAGEATTSAPWLDWFGSATNTLANAIAQGQASGDARLESWEHQLSGGGMALGWALCIFSAMLILSGYLQTHFTRR